MKLILILSTLLLISGCTTRAIWDQTLTNTHDRTYKVDITPEQLAEYKNMAETNQMIQVDPVTEVVYIKKTNSKRIGEIAITALITPITLLIDIPIWLIMNSSDE